MEEIGGEGVAIIFEKMEVGEGFFQVRAGSFWGRAAGIGNGSADSALPSYFYIFRLKRAARGYLPSTLDFGGMAPVSNRSWNVALTSAIL